MTGLGARLVQTPEITQELKLNPRLYQAMGLVYLPLLELQQRLKEEMAENPFLEMVEGDTEQEVQLEEEAPVEPDDEMDWEAILLDGFDVGGRRAQYEPRDLEIPIPTQAPNLHEHLEAQLRFLSLSDRELELAREIIGNIDDDGFLRSSPEEITDTANAWFTGAESTTASSRSVGTPEASVASRAEAGTTPEHAAATLAPFAGEEFTSFTTAETEAVLRVIQELDPPGVAARDLRECILIQLRRGGEEHELVWTLVNEYFDDLVNHRWTRIGKALEIAPRRIQKTATQLAKLDPKPGLRYSPAPDHYVVPDLIVQRISGEYLVFANDSSMPQLRLAQSYQEVARDERLFQGENKAFISEKLNSASWMIQAIEQRRQTMLKVMNFIVERQRDFFEKGVQYLRPLTLREVAEHIEMHESTVSRVTNQKYVQTPLGIFSLKYFFSSGLETTGGREISARGVRAKMKALIADENSRKPLTDMALVKLLRADGVKIARRTVAKYRDQIGILPARMRKQL